MAKKKGTTSAAKTATKATKTTAKKSTAAKGGATKSAAKKAGGATKSAAKKAPAVKLSDKQREILSRIASSGAGGYNVELKPEQRTIDALQQRKLVKRGAKDKASGRTPYHITKAGEKALSAGAGGAQG